MTPFLLAVAMTLAPAPGDTVVDVRRGDRLVVENFSGSLVVRGWDQDRLDVRGEPGDRAEVTLTRSGSELTLRPSSRRGRGREVDAVVRVPRWMELQVGGREVEVSVSQVEGGVSVRNVEGDIEVLASRGPVRVRSVDGEVRVTDVQGRVEARSQGDDVTLIRVVGDVDVESGSGDLVLQDVDAASLRAETLDGDVRFDGPIRPSGRYEISVHDGDAMVAIPRDAGLAMEVATFDGEFMSEFPIMLQRYRGGRSFSFTLGDGSASMKIQVFDGEIQLRARR